MARVANGAVWGQQPAPPPEIQAKTEAVASGLVPQETSHARKTIPRAEQQARLMKMRRIVLGACEQMQLAHQRARRRYRCAMVTLTYRPDEAWQPRQISRYMQRVRDWLHRRRAPLHAVWVLELQKRGAPHYHVLIWLPKGLSLPKPDKQGWWPHGHSRIEWARKPVGYMAKYASKGEQNTHRLPVGARLYGVYGSPVHLGWWRAPQWLRQIGEQGHKIRRRPGGWWAVEELAHAWRSPWRVVEIRLGEIEIEWVGWTAEDVIDLWRLDIAERLEKR